jgi:hypothetical protein
LAPLTQIILFLEMLKNTQKLIFSKEGIFFVKENEEYFEYSIFEMEIVMIFWQFKKRF